MPNLLVKYKTLATLSNIKRAKVVDCKRGPMRISVMIRLKDAHGSTRPSYLHTAYSMPAHVANYVVMADILSFDCGQCKLSCGMVKLQYFNLLQPASREIHI